MPQTWSSWFEWAVPEAAYFVDSRFELYPAEIWVDLNTISGGGAAAGDVLDRRQVEVMVLPASWMPPAGAWTTVYSDAAGSILVGPPIR